MSAKVRAFGPVLVIEASGSGSEFERRPIQPGLPTIDVIFVGSGEFAYLEGGTWRASRGPLMIAPSGLPHRVRFTSAWQFLVARIPREALLPYVPGLTDSVGIYEELTIPERAMEAFLAQSVRSVDEVSASDGFTVGRMVLEMAGTMAPDTMPAGSIARAMPGSWALPKRFGVTKRARSSPPNTPTPGLTRRASPTGSASRCVTSKHFSPTRAARWPAKSGASVPGLPERCCRTAGATA